jgi:putative PIN family toxin of toxin-antitoxin system
VRRILAEKFDWSPAMLRQTLPVIWSMGTLVVPRSAITAVRDDPDDNRILECALEAEADFVISGDRHLLSLKSYQAISVLTPRQFLEVCMK